jgi:uncharacterized protein YllA (UPF0747 family)
MDRSFVAARRPEPEFASRWGIYSPATDQWIDVFFATRAETEMAIAVLNRVERLVDEH